MQSVEATHHIPAQDHYLMFLCGYQSIDDFPTNLCRLKSAWFMIVFACWLTSRATGNCDLDHFSRRKVWKRVNRGRDDSKGKIKGRWSLFFMVEVGILSSYVCHLVVMSSQWGLTFGSRTLQAILWLQRPRVFENESSIPQTLKFPDSLNWN